MFRKYSSRMMIVSLVLCGSFTTNVNAQSGNNGWQTWGTAGDGAAQISVLLRSGTLGLTNSPHPQFRVVNNGITPLHLSALTLRYWFNCDCPSTSTYIAGFGDWAGILPSGEQVSHLVRGFFEFPTAGNQTHALVLRFDSSAPVLQPGEFVEIHTRFNKGDWSAMPQSNDYSYAPYNNFTSWDRVTGYINDVLVWGYEP